MAPVGYMGFRWATQLDPLWNAYLLALVIELAPEIENARVSSDSVHSHRFDSSVDEFRLFDRDGYLAFNEASMASAQEFEWVVVTDIADFYPRVYHHRLDNALKEIAGDTDLPSRILRLLGRWSSNTSYGLPVGGPAARLLSELVLNRTDRLLKLRHRTFHRYADDYRLFANSRVDAHHALVELSELLLRNEGLALSKQKTRIMTRSEFISTLDHNSQDSDDPLDLDETQDRRQRARELLGLTLRYDPYSPTAVTDYDALKDAIDRIDIVDLFMVELSKPRIDSRLTRKLLRALDLAESSAKAQVCSSLVQNLELLAPLVPQVLQAVRRVLIDADAQFSLETRMKIASQLENRSPVLQLGVNRAYAVRILADGPAHEFDTQLAELYESSLAFIQRDVVVAMARWRNTYWLSDKKTHYDSMHSWVQRSFLMGSYYLGDEGRHWRKSIRKRLSPFDRMTKRWVADRIQQNNWELPL